VRVALIPGLLTIGNPEGTANRGAFMNWQIAFGFGLIGAGVMLAFAGGLLSRQLRPQTESGHDRRWSGEYGPLQRRVLANLTAGGACFVIGVILLVWGRFA